jgi:hypothetical protein
LEEQEVGEAVDCEGSVQLRLHVLTDYVLVADEGVGVELGGCVIQRVEREPHTGSLVIFSICHVQVVQLVRHQLVLEGSFEGDL